MSDYGLLPEHMRLLTVLAKDYLSKDGNSGMFSVTEVPDETTYGEFRAIFEWSDHRPFEYEEVLRPRYFAKLKESGLIDKRSGSDYEINSRGIEAVMNDYEQPKDELQKQPDQLPVLLWIILLVAFVICAAVYIFRPGWYWEPIVAFLGVLIGAPAILAFIEKRIREASKKLWLAGLFLMIGVLVGVGISRWTGFCQGENSPDIALLNLRYVIEAYDPRIVDLRTAATNGIPASEGLSLKFQDLWIWSSKGGEEYSVQAEVYANYKEYIGSSSPSPIQNGAFSIGAITPQKYQNGDLPDAWIVQKDWKDLTVYLYLHQKGHEGHLKLHIIHIKLNPKGTSWVWDAPHARFVSLTYSINNGSIYVLDLPSAVKNGLNASAGNIITLHGAWYKSDAGGGSHPIKLGGYLTKDGYDNTNEKYSQENPIVFGVNEFAGLSPISWEVRQDDKYWVISLERSDDRTLLDRYVIPLNADKNPGLLGVFE